MKNMVSVTFKPLLKVCYKTRPSPASYASYKAILL